MSSHGGATNAHIHTLGRLRLHRVDNRGGAAGNIGTELVAPAGTPPAIVGKLNREVNAILNRADTRSRMPAIGAAPGGGSAEDFRRFIEQETEKWARLIASRRLRK